MYQYVIVVLFNVWLNEPTFLCCHHFSKVAVLWRLFQVFVEHLLEWYSNIIVHLVVCKNFPLNYRQSTWEMISTFCSCGNCLLELLVLAYWDQGPIPERPISINPGFKFCSVFVFYIPMYCLWQHFVFSGSIILKGSTVFCSMLHVLRWENCAWIWLSWIKLNQLSRNRAHVSYRGDKRANNGPSKSSTKKEANQCFRRGR